MPNTKITHIDKCEKCNNYGYYDIGVAGKKERMQMFCACVIGIQLKRMSIKWRLDDMEAVAENILPRITEAHNKLFMPSEAGRVLESLRDDIEKLIKRSKKALKDIDK